jgi:hypothetical protein
MHPIFVLKNGCDKRTRRWHDKRIKKEFAPGDNVLLFNSRVKLFGHGKL